MSLEDRIKNGVVFWGTYIIYAATSRDVIWQIADVEIDTDAQSCLEELRAQRHHFKDSVVTPPPLGDNHLGRELVVVFGPEISAKRAVKALMLIVEDIKQNGLFIGRRKRNSYASMEEFGPRPSNIEDEDEGPKPHLLKVS